MSVDLPRLKALIDLDSEPFNDGVSRVESRIDQFVARIKNTFSKMESLGKKAGATFAALAAATGGVMKITSGYEKELKKIEVVSEGNTKIFNKLNKAVEKLEKSKLFSTPDISKAVSSAYAMGKNYEMTADQIINVTDRAKNLSAIYGFDLYDTTTRLMAALRGEAESSEALGLSLSQTAVKAWMLEEGIAGNIETMSLAEQAQIRYKMLMDNTASSIGAASEMAKTLDGGFARLKNTATDFIKKIGTGFIDKVVEGMNKISDFLDWAGESESLMSLIQNLIKLGFIMSGVGIAIGLMGKIGNTVFSLLSISASIVSSPITLIGIAALAVVGNFDKLSLAWGKFVDKFNQAGSSPEDIKKSFNEMVEGFKSGDLSVILSEGANVVLGSFKFVLESADKVLTKSNIKTYINKDWNDIKTGIGTGNFLEVIRASANLFIDLIWGGINLIGAGLRAIGLNTDDAEKKINLIFVELKDNVNKGDALGILTATGKLGISLAWEGIKIVGQAVSNVLAWLKNKIAAAIPNTAYHHMGAPEGFYEASSKLHNIDVGWFDIVTQAGLRVVNVIFDFLNAAGQVIASGINYLANRVRKWLGINPEGQQTNIPINLGNDLKILLTGVVAVSSEGISFANDFVSDLKNKVDEVTTSLDKYNEQKKQGIDIKLSETDEILLNNLESLGLNIAGLIGSGFSLGFSLTDLIGEAANTAVTELTGSNEIGNLVNALVPEAIQIGITSKWVGGWMAQRATITLPFVAAFGAKGFFLGNVIPIGISMAVNDIVEGAATGQLETALEKVLGAVALGVGVGFLTGSANAGVAAFTMALIIDDVIFEMFGDQFKDSKQKAEELLQMAVRDAVPNRDKLIEIGLSLGEPVPLSTMQFINNDVDYLKTLRDNLINNALDVIAEERPQDLDYWVKALEDKIGDEDLPKYKEIIDIEPQFINNDFNNGVDESTKKMQELTNLIANFPIDTSAQIHIGLDDEGKETVDILDYTGELLGSIIDGKYVPVISADATQTYQTIGDVNKELNSMPDKTVNITTGITENYDTNLSDTIGTINSSIDLFISKLLDLNNSVNDKVLDIDEVINRLKEKGNISKGQQGNIITANNSAIPELTKYIDIPTLLSYYGAESSYGATSNNHFQFNPSTVDDIERITDWLYSLGELTQTYSDIFGSDGFNPTDVTESTKAAQIYLTWLKKSLSQALGYEAPDFVVLSAWNNGLNEVMNFIKTAQSEGENINWLGLLKFRSETETLVTNYNYFHNCMMGIADDARTLDEKINNLGDISITKNIDNFQHQYLYSYDSLLTVKDELNNLNPNYQGFDNTINAIFETGNVIRYGSKVFNNTSDVDNSKPQGAVDEIFDFINYGSDKFIKTPGIDSSKPKENIDAAVEVIEYAYSKFNDLTSMDVSEFNLSLTDPANKTYQATGGYISGPGNGTSDSIPAMLSNGEYVINAAATSKWLPLLESINSGSKLPGYKSGGPVLSLPKYSSGGSVDIDTFDTSEFIKPLETALTGFDKTVGNLLSIVAKAATGIIEGLSSILEAMGVDSDTIDVVSGAVSDLQSLIEEIRQDANNALDELNKTPTNNKIYNPATGDAFDPDDLSNYSTSGKIEEKAFSWFEDLFTKLEGIGAGSLTKSADDIHSESGNAINNIAKGNFKEAGVNLDNVIKKFGDVFDSTTTILQSTGMPEQAAAAAGSLAVVAVAGLAAFKAFDNLVGLTKALSGAFQSGIKSATSSTLDRISTPFKRLGYLIGRAIVPVLESLEPVIAGIAEAFAVFWNILAGIISFFSFGLINFGQIDIDKLKGDPDKNHDDLEGTAGNNQPVTNNYNVSFEGNTIIDTDDEAMKLIAEKFKQYVQDHGGVEVFFK